MSSAKSRSKKLRGAGFEQLFSIRNVAGLASTTNAKMRETIVAYGYKKAFTLLGAYPPNNGQPLKRPAQVAVLNAIHMIAVLEKQKNQISDQELSMLVTQTPISPEAIAAFAQNYVNTMPQEEEGEGEGEGEGQGKKRGGRFPTSINTQDIENVRKFLRGDAMFSLLPQRLTSYLGLISLKTLPIPFGKMYIDLKKEGRREEDIDNELAQLLKTNNAAFADFISAVKEDLAEYDLVSTTVSTARSVLDGQGKKKFGQPGANKVRVKATELNKFLRGRQVQKNVPYQGAPLGEGEFVMPPIPPELLDEPPQYATFRPPNYVQPQIYGYAPAMSFEVPPLPKLTFRNPPPKPPGNPEGQGKCPKCGLRK